MVSFQGTRFPKDRGLTWVRWSVASLLSARPAEERMQARGVSIDHPPINRWVLKHSPKREQTFQHRQRPVWLSWRLVVAVHVWLGGAGLHAARMDHILSLINLAACATYLYSATGTVYRASGAVQVIEVLALALAVAGIMLGYRFVLFLITLYTL